MTSISLPLDIEEKLEYASRESGKSKSELITEALAAFFFVHDESVSYKSFDSYRLGEKYFGRYGSGQGNFSTDYKKILRDKLNAKYHTY